MLLILLHAAAACRSAATRARTNWEPSESLRVGERALFRHVFYVGRLRALVQTLQKCANVFVGNERFLASEIGPQQLR